MAVFASDGLPWRWGVLTRLKAATGPTALDRRLARGADPEASRELACRAHVLRGWRVRHAFADGIERIVTEAEHPDHRYSARVPVAREEVLAARPDLMRVAEALRAEPPVTVREAVFRAPIHLEAG